MNPVPARDRATAPHGVAERRLAWAFGATILIIAGNALVSYRDMLDQARNTRAVVAVRDLLDRVAAVGAALGDAETSRRGYLLDRDPAERADCEAALRRVDAATTALDEATRDAAAPRAGGLAPAARGCAQVLRESLDRAAASEPWRHDAAAANTIRQQLADCRARVEQAEAEGRRELAARVEERQGGIGRAFATFSLASALALVTLGMTHLLVRRQLADRRRAGRAMRDSEARFRLLFESVGEGIYGIDTEGRCTFCNPAALRLLGFRSPADVLGREMHALVHHSYADGTPFPAHLCPIYATVHAGEGVIGIEDDFFAADGTPIPVEYRAHAIRRGDQILGAVVTFVVIAARRQSERDIRLRDRALRATGQGVFILDQAAPGGPIVFANGAFERLTGFGRADWEGRGIDLIRGEHADDAYDDLRHALRDGRPAAAEWPAGRKDGSTFWQSLTLTPLEDPPGRVSHFVGLMTDLTRAKQVETELRAAKEAAEAAIQAKSTFLANMGHELRTPLNAIIGYSEMLEDEAVDRGVGEFVPDLRRIAGAGRMLLKLINNVLDLSRIDSGSWDLAAEPFDLGDTIRGVLRAVQPLAEQRGNHLQVDYPGDLGVLVGDVARTGQALGHLLTNALKFTEGGIVSFRARRERDPCGSEWAVFAVADDGIGMTQDEIGRLFQPFVQGESSAARRYGGTGLGLILTQRFCQMVGGSIDVVSEPGRGSTFTMRLPVGRAANPDVQVEGPRRDAAN